MVRTTDTREALDAITEVQGRATLLIAPTAPLSDRMLAEVAATDRVRTVLVEPDAPTLAALAPWATVSELSTSTDEVAPDCGWDVGQRVGALPRAGTVYATTSSDVLVCWAGGVLDDSRRTEGTRTTVVGMSRAFTNEHLDESGIRGAHHERPRPRPDPRVVAALAPRPPAARRRGAPVDLRPRPLLGARGPSRSSR